MHEQLDLSPDIDLLPFSQFLWKQKVVHRITERAGRQILWLECQEKSEIVHQWFVEWQKGELVLNFGKQNWWEGFVFTKGTLGNWKKMPVCLSLVFVCLVFVVVTNFGKDYSKLSWFTFVDFRIFGDYIAFSPFRVGWSSHQYWRVITPIFIHFGFIHFIFNMLWLIEFGGRIEQKHKSYWLLLLVIMSGLVSNILQYLLGGEGKLFGGFSGVIYALMGFMWMRERKHEGLYGLPSGLYFFMLIWLVVGFSGVLKVIGFGQLANTAHATGLVAGGVLGWLYDVIGFKYCNNILGVTENERNS